jgi:hypothetical protein
LQEAFEIILTLAEYEKDKIKCPKCGGKYRRLCLLRCDVEEKLKEGGGEN